MLTPIPTNESNSINVLQNGITSILEAIHNLIPAWGTTASHLNTTAQSLQLNQQLHQPISLLQLCKCPNHKSMSLSIQNPYLFLMSTKDQGIKWHIFVWACNQYFAQAEVTRDEVKIAMALVLMKGDKSSKWSDNQLELIQEGKTDALTNWAQFQQSFKDQFGDHTPPETTAANVQVLQMGNRPEDEYNNEFNNLKNDTGWNKVALLDHYKLGLEKNLLLKIYACDALSISLQEWQDKSDLLDRQWRQLKVMAEQADDER
ncbi:hypothetical protein H2248_004008 [Termitomyces sp. 'cryptogamus']|nr:hypothetical protein H2248_004008 [Termitomyces sp. 'cryptogamus']